ncbi:hypothetical protein WJR50_28385 [Catalinimonas sp. 4WD22]|uniref:hypothetical protein n=1 Tax=Catalinimonas locisalis TaxID=3133978 RepID=UPI0031012570
MTIRILPRGISNNLIRRAIGIVDEEFGYKGRLTYFNHVFSQFPSTPFPKG